MHSNNRVILSIDLHKLLIIFWDLTYKFSCLHFRITTINLNVLLLINHNLLSNPLKISRDTRGNSILV